MSTIREAHTPRDLERKLSKDGHTVEAAIEVYKKQAEDALKNGDKDLHRDYMQIIEDIQNLSELLAARGIDKNSPVVKSSKKTEKEK